MKHQILLLEEGYKDVNGFQVPTFYINGVTFLSNEEQVLWIYDFFNETMLSMSDNAPQGTEALVDHYIMSIEQELIETSKKEHFN